MPHSYINSLFPFSITSDNSFCRPVLVFFFFYSQNLLWWQSIMGSGVRLVHFVTPQLACSQILFQVILDLLLEQAFNMVILFLCIKWPKYIFPEVLDIQSFSSCVAQFSFIVKFCLCWSYLEPASDLNGFFFWFFLSSSGLKSDLVEPLHVNLSLPDIHWTDKDGKKKQLETRD